MSVPGMSTPNSIVRRLDGRRLVGLGPGEFRRRDRVIEAVVLGPRLGRVDRGLLQFRQLAGGAVHREGVRGICVGLDQPPRSRAVGPRELDGLRTARQRQARQPVLGKVPVEVALALALGRGGHLALEEKDEREERRHDGREGEELARRTRPDQSLRRYQTQSPRRMARPGSPAIAKMPIRRTWESVSDSDACSIVFGAIPICFSLPVSQWMALAKRTPLPPLAIAPSAAKREFPMTTRRAAFPPVLLLVRRADRDRDRHGPGRVPGLLLDRSVAFGQGLEVRLAPALRRGLDEHRLGDALRRLLGLRHRPREREDDRKALGGEGPHDRVSPVLVGEDRLGADHRQGVGRIDHDVVAEPEAVLAEKLREAEVRRRRARTGQDGVEQDQGMAARREVLLEGARLRRQERGPRPGHDDDFGARRKVVLAERGPGRDGHVVALEQLLGLGVAAPPLARIERGLVVALREDDPGLLLLGHREDRGGERLLALEGLDRGRPAHLRGGEVEVGELVLLDVLLAVSRAEDHRVLANAELLERAPRRAPRCASGRGTRPRSWAKAPGSATGARAPAGTAARRRS